MPKLGLARVIIFAVFVLVMGQANYRPSEAAQVRDVPKYEDVVLIKDKSFDGISLDGAGKLYWVDYFSGKLGTYDLASKRITVLLTGLKHPAKIKVFGNRAYFIEAGTDKQKYRDGTLSYLDTGSKEVHLLLGNLTYPNGLHVSSHLSSLGDVYFTEGGNSTAWGGVNQLCVLRKSMQQKTIIAKDIPGIGGVVVHTGGAVFVGIMGPFSPGDGGQLLEVYPSKEIVLKGLPSPNDFDVDVDGQIYSAGFGGKNSEFGGITMISVKDPSYSSYIAKRGVFVWSLAVDKNGDIYYSTIRRPESDNTSNSLRVLRLAH